MINKKYLPSKKFLIALTITVVLILVALGINYWKTNTISNSKNNLIAIASTTAPSIETDSDNDGLPDWKEALYGTDPHNPDTDGDGTNDGDEIAQGRDPLKANTAPKGQKPNDYISPEVIAKNKQIVDDYQALSETDKFSRNLISNIIAAQPQNGTISQDTTNAIITDSLQQIPQKNYTGVTKVTDLTLLQTDSTNLNKNMSGYAKNYFAETEKLRLFLGSDIYLIISYMSPNSTTTKSDILGVAKKYQNIVNALIKMPVPVAIGYYDINYHLTVINDLEKIIAIDKDAANSSGASALDILPDLSIYGDTIKNLDSTLATIDSILKIQR